MHQIGFGNKVVLDLCIEGEEKIGAFIDQSFQLAKDFHALLEEEEDFSTPYFPQSNILCFHYDKFSEDDDFQKRLRYAIINEKRFYITSCEMNGRRYLRVVLLHPRYHD